MVARPAALQPRARARLLDAARTRRSARSCARAGTRELFVERLIVPQVCAVWSADPAQMWTFPARFLAQFFHNHGMLSAARPAAVADRRGRLAHLRRRDRARLRGRSALRTPVARRSRATPTTSTSPVRGGRRRALRRGDPRVPQRPGARAARRPEPRRARDPRRDPLPGQRGGPAHRRVAAPAPARRAAGLELPPARRAARPHDGHLLDEPSAAPGRRARLLRHAEPHRADRPCAGHPHDHLRPPGLHARTGIAAQARHGEISGVRRTHYCGAYWRWGFHEDGVWSALRAIARPQAPSLAACAGRARSSRHEHRAAAPLRGLGHPPARDAGRPRLPLPRLHALPRPRRAARRRSTRHPLWSTRHAAPGRFRRADHLGRPGRAARRRRARRGRASDRPRAPPARSACSRPRARSATRSTR